MRRLLKYKTEKNTHLTLDWEVGDPDDEDNGMLGYALRNCRDRPLPTFHGAIKDMLPHLTAMLLLDDDYTDNLSLSGLSLSWSKGIMGATFNLKKDLGDGTIWAFTTPHYPAEPYGDGDGAMLAPQLTLLLQTFQAEAFAYIDGQRLQRSLPLKTKVTSIELFPAADRWRVTTHRDPHTRRIVTQTVHCDGDMVAHIEAGGPHVGEPEILTFADRQTLQSHRLQQPTDEPTQTREIPLLHSKVAEQVATYDPFAVAEEEQEAVLT